MSCACLRGCNFTKSRDLSALDAYINRVYRIIVLFVPSLCICAAATITFLEIEGLYPPISPYKLVLFDLSTVIYMAIGGYFARTGFDDDGILRQDKLRSAKMFLAVILVIQWNAIAYVWPFMDLWSFALLFTISTAFFFDYALVACVSLGIGFSIALSWLIGADMLMPPFGHQFTMNMVFRLVGLSLMLLSVNLITYLGGKFLVEELEKYVNFDTLTHLLNRRSMDKYLNGAYRRAKSGNSTFCLLMIDIDDFKKVNDTYGHDCGDAVLRYVADTVSRGVRTKDNVFRWGGEEILALINADEERAMHVAERIRKDIAASHVSYRGNVQVAVTVTMGVAPYRVGATLQSMMDEADANLYYGKRHGKNRVVRTENVVES